MEDSSVPSSLGISPESAFSIPAVAGDAYPALYVCRDSQQRSTLNYSPV
jgi:hypothetical protein